MIKDAFLVADVAFAERPRPVFDVPERPGTRYAIVTDKETTATAVALSDLRPARNQGSVGGYRDIMLDQLFGAMLDARLDELSQRENPPFLRAAADRRLFPMPRTKDEALLQALVVQRRRRRAASTRWSPRCSASRGSASPRPSSRAPSRR